MIYVIYLPGLSDLYHDLSFRSISSRSWSIWYICPIYLIQVMIYIIYPPHLSDQDHDLPDPSSDPTDPYHDLSCLSVRSIWSISWSFSLVYLIQIMIHLIYMSDISDLDHNLSNLSDLVDLDHDLSNIYMPDLSDLIHLLNLSYLYHDLPDIFFRSIWSGLSV